MKYLPILLLLTQVVAAQNSTNTLSTSSIEIEFDTTNGTIADFRLKNHPTGTISLLGHASFWMLGIDPGGNLKWVMQDSVAHLKMGFRGVPNSNKIWKVTQAEIEAHRADFADNGMIDDTIPAIFSWPAFGNPFSEDLNGFSMDDELEYPRFWDFGAFNYEYEPHLGDYPYLGVYYTNTQFPPSEMLFIPMYSEATNDIPAMDFYILSFVFDCPMLEAVHNSAFVYLYLSLKENYDLDSTNLSWFVDGNIGNPNDDYVGTHPENSQVYFYNSNDSFDSQLGSELPTLFYDIQYGLLDTFGTSNSLTGAITPFSNNSAVHSNMLMPEGKFQVYRYSNAEWRNGRPIREVGNGYSDNGGLTNFIFHGDPADLTEWSEVSAANPLADRFALANSHSELLRKGGANKQLINLTALPNVKHSDLRQKVAVGEATLEDFLWNDNFNPPWPPYNVLCYGTNPSTELKPSTDLLVYPNPTSDFIRFLNPPSDPAHLTILDMQGKTIFSERIYDFSKPLDVFDWTAGLYQIRLIDGKSTVRTGKFLKL